MLWCEVFARPAARAWTVEILLLSYNEEDASSILGLRARPCVSHHRVPIATFAIAGRP